MAEKGEEWCAILLDSKVYYVSRPYLKDKTDGPNGYFVVFDLGTKPKEIVNKNLFGLGVSEIKEKFPAAHTDEQAV